MQFKIFAVLAIAATASAQLSSLTAGIVDGIKSQINNEVQSLIPTNTRSGIVGDLLSSARASASNYAESKIGITASGTTTTGTATQAAATSTGAANYNQVAQMGVGAAVVAGFWGMVV